MNAYGRPNTPAPMKEIKIFPNTFETLLVPLLPMLMLIHLVLKQADNVGYGAQVTIIGIEKCRSEGILCRFNLGYHTTVYCI